MTVAVAASRTAWSVRGWAVYLAFAAITLDGSALNLGLPTITAQFGASPGSISWAVDAYTLPLASLLLLGGSLGDRWGAERLFQIGARGFAGASVVCALSPSMALLIAGRAAQGLCAALLLPMVLAVIGKSFVDPVERSRAVNLLTLFGGFGMAVGPFLGGLLTDTIGWPVVFWFTALLAVIASCLLGPADERPTEKRPLRVDLTGQIAGTAGLVAVVAGLIESGNGAGVIPGTALLLVGAGLLLAFVLIERRADAPMMPLEVFRRPGFAPTILGGFAFQFGAYGLQFYLAVHLQSAWGLSALAGGLLLISFALGLAVASVVANPLLMKRGSRHMIVIGAAIATTGTLGLLAVTGPERGWLLVVAELVIGTGTGIYSTALNTAAGSSLGADAAGLASGIYNTARQVGQCVGIAILGALAMARDTRAGYVIAVIVVTCCALGIGVTGWGARRAPAPSVR